MKSSFLINKKKKDGYSYVYLENNNDCCCIWTKNHENKNVYSIERLNVLFELRRQGIGRYLLKKAIGQIKDECSQACIEISARPDKNSEVNIDVLVKFYESEGFEKYQNYCDNNRMDLRLYLDESIKPEPVWDSSYYFEYYRNLRY